MAGHDGTAQRAVLIAGPTASGKSALALAVAERLGGVIVNADAMQVYADLAILTARPSATEMARVPHRLFGHVDAAEVYSVGRWLEEVEVALRAVWNEGLLPVVVGGTGLYFKGLVQGLSAIPDVPEAVRARIRLEAEGLAPSDLHGRLMAVDPVMGARLRPTDPQRILRALEIFEATGASLASFQASRCAPLLPIGRYVGVTLAMDRPVLNQRIDDRFDAMMKAGAADEIVQLAARDLDPGLPALRALGVPALLAALRGEVTMPDAVAEGKLLTRRYAKRQATFFRHQLPDFVWVAPDMALDDLLLRWSALAS